MWNIWSILAQLGMGTNKTKRAANATRVRAVGTYIKSAHNHFLLIWSRRRKRLAPLRFSQAG